MESAQAGFVVAAVLASFLGSLLALGLLERRTSTQGWINWFHLLGTATALGAVGMWSSHFLGNRAHGPEPPVRYSISGTILSLFTPIVVVGASLYPMNRPEIFSAVEVVIHGILTAGGALAMHFIMDASMLNYRRVSILPGDYSAAILVMLITNFLAFGIFLHAKASWTSSFIKRSISAGLLAGSMSAMQWLLKRGTGYQFTGTANKSTASLSRKAEAIVPLCLAVGCFIGLVILALMGWVSKQKAAKRIPQVLLACAFFDSQERLMVTPEGCVPCQKITKTPLERGFGDLFDMNNPIFCWMYRASFCWSAIQDAIPRIPAQIKAVRAVRTAGPESQAPITAVTASEDENPPDQSLLFRLLLFVAANDLASMIHQPIGKIGTLFGGVLDIGTVRKPTKKFLWFFKGPSAQNIIDRSHPDEEAHGNRTFGRGQALFLVRSVSTKESMELRAAGYRFVAPTKILSAFAKNLEITKPEALKHLQQMRRSSDGERVLAPGVHLACFLIRPEFHRGLGILVNQQARNVLPTTQLPIPKLEPWHTHFLRRMRNFTLEECYEQLNAESNNVNERERTFAAQLLRALVDLRTQVDHPMLAKALLCVDPVESPSGMPGESSALNLAVIIAFRLMLDVHPNTPLKPGFMFQPWRFFVCQQRVYIGYPHHGAFVHHMRREIESLRRDDVPAAKQSAVARAQQSLRRLSRTAVDSMRHETSTGSRRWTLPSSSNFTLNRFRRSNAKGKRPANRNIDPTPEGAEVEMDLLEMLSTSPTHKTTTNNDVAPLDKKTYAEVLMGIVAADRGKERAMNRIGPSF